MSVLATARSHRINVDLATLERLNDIAAGSLEVQSRPIAAHDPFPDLAVG